MKKEKSEWDLLYVWPAFVPVMRFKGKMYVEIRDFECCIRDIQRELEGENKKLKEEVRFLEECLDRKEKVNKILREELSVYDREYFDEDKKASEIYKEQYQHSMWEDDELIYEEWLYD